MAYIYSSDRLRERLFKILYDSDPRICVYIYRYIDGKRIKPYLHKTQPFEDLETYIAKTFGDGAYWLMIRRGENMLLSGEIGLLMRLKPPKIDQTREFSTRF